LDTTIDYYSLLGIKRTSTAPEIKRAYRKMVFRYHPDRNPGDGEAAAKLNQVLEAYSILSDADKRAIYDEATRPIFDEELEEETAQQEQFGSHVGGGFQYSYDFQKKAEPQPKCPQCAAMGTDFIVSRKGGTGTSRGKQFILAPFSIIFCSECGHVYGVTGQSS
jgi:curved DNA-binding protein CbpA